MANNRVKPIQVIQINEGRSQTDETPQSDNSGTDYRVQKMSLENLANI